MWAWGDRNMPAQNDFFNRSSPVQVGTLSTWSKVASGNEHAVAIKTDGTMWVWGKNGWGQLGDNAVGVYKSSPVQLGALTTWSKSFTGAFHSMAIKTDGTLWAWGRNEQSQLGDNSAIHRSSPIQVGALTTWSKVDGGNQHTIALKTDGTMWSWGRNNSGQLGVIGYKSSPVQIGAQTTWTQIAAGAVHNLAIG